MTQKTLETMSFEEAMGELEALVRKLEEGKFPLEEAIQAYERGVVLRKFCEDKLKAAQMKVEQVILNAEGQTKTEEFS